MARSGFEVPVTSKDQDKLDRWLFALNIYEYITNVPKEWSVRVGIYGKWGEGKTSVLEFIEDIALKEKHVVVKFNPWSVGSKDELWIKFISELVEKLKASKVVVPRDITRKLSLFKISKSAKELSKINNIANVLVGYGLSLTQDFLNVDGKLLKNIKSTLDSKRIIVMVDDLDRTDPTLIPHLLMSFRELLDIPGFSFVLPFDNEIIANSLSDHHKAWGNGYEFLEKIIDFHFHLPIPTNAQIRKMFDEAIKESCAFISSNNFEDIYDLLPNNPRKLKLFVRNLSVLEKEFKRHDTDEFDWSSILICQLIRQESEAFLQEYMNEFMDFGKMLVSVETFSGDKEEKEKKQEERISKMIVKYVACDEDKKNRLMKLARALSFISKVYSNEDILYHANFAFSPHAVTLKELRTLINVFGKTPKNEEVEKWLVEHSKSRSTSIFDVANELFAKLINCRDRLLSDASDVSTLESHDEIMKEVKLCLELIELLVFGKLKNVEDNYFVSTSNFQLILDQAIKWLHFNTNESDKSARQGERDFLLRYVKLDLSNPESYVDIVAPWASDAFRRELKSSFRKELADQLEPAVAKKLIQLLDIGNGFERLWDYDNYYAYRYLLFRNGSPLWNEQYIEIIEKKVISAAGNRAIQENFITIIELLMSALRGAMPGLPSEDIKKLVTGTKAAKLIWDGATAREIQFRAKSDYLEKRKDLIDNGVDEKDLTMPKWLD